MSSLHSRKGDPVTVLRPNQPLAGSPAPRSWSIIRRGLVSRLYPILTELWQFLDAAAVAGALYVLSHTHGTGFDDKHLVLATVTAMLMLTVYSWSDLFYRMRTRSLQQEAGRLLHAWTIVLVLLMAIGYLTQTQHHFSRDFMLIWAGVAYWAQMVLHIIVRNSLHFMRRRGYNIRRALVVGCGAPLERYVRLVSKNPWFGIRVEGYIAEPHWFSVNPDNFRQTRGPMTASGGAANSKSAATFAAPQPERAAEAPELAITGRMVRHLGGVADVARLVDELSITEIYVTMPLERSADADAVLRALVKVPVNVNWLPDFSVIEVLSTRTDELNGQLLVLLSDSRIERHGRLFKLIEDMVLSSILIVLLAPLMLAIAWAVKRSSPGPVLFKQQRLGMGGRRVEVWKFRTMGIGPQTDIPRQATRGDDRVTPIGRLLRRWSLDELPQLFNVLQGHMSLVGPRPHPLWLNDQFSDVVSAYMQRHLVKPGLTGWAQVNGYRGETDTWEKMEQRVKYDVYYITHWSPWLDLKILARTVAIVIRGSNAY